MLRFTLRWEDFRYVGLEMAEGSTQCAQLPGGVCFQSTVND
jgi:hypothetical protein